SSNLQRQVLYTIDDIGRQKVEAALERLQRQNPFVEFEKYNLRLSSENALDIISEYDIIADGTDNFPTRYLVNDATVKAGKVNVYASIFRFEGQLSVFNYRDPEGNYGPNFRDLFPSPPPPGLVPSCAEGGVIGVLPGILGSLQANEVIKIAAGVGEPLSGKLFTLNTSEFEPRVFELSYSEKHSIRTEHADQIELIDYEQFCGIGPAEEQTEVKSITVGELSERLDKGEDVQVIDVREPNEYEIANIGAELIPKSTVESKLESISRDRPVVVHCRSGKRSHDVIALLQERHGYDNLLNLEGGILAWAQEIDETMATY
ncbi:MAG: molybdenum cofactor biosynthesis protein MoeB, partial [Flavobacteriales bacterium]|nr:molybdenum cofactor biosynthesis protein MoeB [Flavobacteriales bacterium]